MTTLEDSKKGLLAEKATSQELVTSLGAECRSLEGQLTAARSSAETMSDSLATSGEERLETLEISGDD